MSCYFPLVTVCIPNFNYAHTVGSAIHSVLRQTFKSYEIIIIDDGSTDDSIKILEEWRSCFPDVIKIVKHPNNQNLGLTGTYKLALEHARGEYIAFLEADDVWSEDYLERKVNVFNTNQNVGVVFSMYRPFGEKITAPYWNIYQYTNKLSLPAGRPFNALSSLLLRNPVASFSHFMVRSSCVNSIPYPENKELFLDWWLLAHLALKTDFYYDQEPQTLWRIHQKSANYKRFNLEQLETLQSFLLRLYGSLKPAATNSQAKLINKKEQKIYTYRQLTQKKRLVGLMIESLKEPVQSFRFLMHIVLKNFFFKTPKATGHV